MVPLPKAQQLVTTAIEFKSERAHKNAWHKDVHHTVLKEVLGTSRHSRKHIIKSVHDAGCNSQVNCPHDTSESTIPTAGPLTSHHTRGQGREARGSSY